MTAGGQTSGDNSKIGECANITAISATLNEQAKAIEALASAVESLTAALNSKSITIKIQDELGGEDAVSSFTMTTLDCGQFEETLGCGGIHAGFCTT